MQFSVPGFFVVLLIIVITGVVGGIRNWISDGPFQYRKKQLLAFKIIDAMVASASIPLFLSVIGNEKVSPAFGEIRIFAADYQQALFILIGFCALASIFSQRFLDTLSRKVMQLNDKMEVVEQRVEQATAIAEMQIESDRPTEANQSDGPAVEANLTNDQEKILRALGRGQFLMRSIGGLAESTGISGQSIAAALTGLAEMGFVKNLSTPKGERWALTDQGRDRGAQLAGP